MNCMTLERTDFTLFTGLRQSPTGRRGPIGAETE
jgi:hypothetical protein